MTVTALARGYSKNTVIIDMTASEFAGSDVNSHIYHSLAATSQILPELAIIYEDQDILAINKPAGIVTHPSGSHYSDSLANQVASYFRSKGEPTKVRSIGRLDKETSGILLFARNQTAAARLQNQREDPGPCLRNKKSWNLLGYKGFQDF